MERSDILIHLLHLFSFFVPIFLYAETHYRFRYFFSWLKKNEPEILADAPHRIQPHAPLPVLLLIKDADRFPIKLLRIEIHISQNGQHIQTNVLSDIQTNISDKFWWSVVTIPLHEVNGWIDVDVRFTVEQQKQSVTYHNDNHRTSSRKPLRVFVADETLPSFPNLFLGETHSHSNYTDDHVEFGAPLAPARQLAGLLGLSFFCVTDHSYDLDDTLESYLVNDLEIPKWKLLQQEVDTLNAGANNFIIMRGEEVSCRNSDDHNVHFLLLGNRNFVFGSGDGAEKWSQTRSEHSIEEILKQKESTTATYAAHPREKVSLIQKLLLNRSKWKKADFNHAALHGIQFANGMHGRGFSDGKRMWIEALLRGQKLYALAGNDAHGNFSRFRQIGIPFFKIKESSHQLFGKMRTGVFLSMLSEENILHALRNGNSILTDGPVMNITDATQATTLIGNTFVGISHTILLSARTSKEFGGFHDLQIIKGTIGAQREQIIETMMLHGEYSFAELRTITIDSPSYIRVEAWTNAADATDKQSHFCFTNPVWVSPE
jgi:hypothetical protein